MLQLEELAPVAHSREGRYVGHESTVLAFHFFMRDVAVRDGLGEASHDAKMSSFSSCTLVQDVVQAVSNRRIRVSWKPKTWNPSVCSC